VTGYLDAGDEGAVSWVNRTFA